MTKRVHDEINEIIDLVMRVRANLEAYPPDVFNVRRCEEVVQRLRTLRDMVEGEDFQIKPSSTISLELKRSLVDLVRRKVGMSMPYCDDEEKLK